MKNNYPFACTGRAKLYKAVNRLHLSNVVEDGIPVAEHVFYIPGRSGQAVHSGRARSSISMLVPQGPHPPNQFLAESN